MSRSSTSSSEPGRESVAQDGLIEAPETFGGGRPLLFAVVSGFLFLLVGTGIVDTVHPRRLPELQGDEKTRDDAMRAQAQLLDGSLARLIENDLRLKSRVRKKLTEPYAWFLYWRLQEAQRVIVGEGGWLFLESRTLPPRAAALGAAARSTSQLSALDRLLYSRGSKLVAVPVPRKSVVLEELLPRGVNPLRQVEEDLVAALREHGVPTADLLGAFEGTPVTDLFHFGDSHWTALAEILAAEEVSAVGGFRIPPEERETELVPQEGAALGLDLFRWIGAEVDGSRPELQPYRRDKYNVHEKETGKLVRRKNQGEVWRIALAGTSYSARRSLPVFLTHCSGETVWNAAEPGEGPMKPLRRFLSSLEGAPWPEVLVLEFPLHLTLSTRGMRTIAGIFADWSPPGVTPVAAQDAWETWPLEKSKKRNWKRFASLRGGVVGHSGDGVACVRLVGKASDRVDILVHQGKTRLEYRWDPERSELVLPLMTPDPSSGQVTLSVRANQATKLELEEVAIVSPVEPRAVGEARIEPPRESSEAGRWIQDVRFPAGAEVPEHGVAWLRLPATRIKGRFRVEARIEGSDEVVRTWRFRTLLKDGQILLGLDGLAGERLAALRLTGAGRPPGKGLVAAGIHVPFVQ